MGRWQKHVVPKVLEELRTYTYKPTIRGMFYLLASNKAGNVLENTYPEYKKFIAAMSTARRNGSVPIDAFADDTRGIYDINDIYRTPERYVDYRIDWLKNAKTYYFDSIPRWHQQKHYVEIWCEKAALRGLFVNIVEKENLQVRVIVNKGWSSMAYRQSNFDRLLRKSRQDTDEDGNEITKQFHVLYFGDYDPSGRRMDLNIKLDLALAMKGWNGRRLEKKSDQLRRGIEEYHGEMYDWITEAEDNELFKRVALTKPQIREYELQGLENPDPEVKRKLENDPNKDAFINENGSLFQIEVDALQKDPRFKDLVINAVNNNGYFDQSTFERMKQEYTPKCIDVIVNGKVKFLDGN